jgi:hypothetical protein
MKEIGTWVTWILVILVILFCPAIIVGVISGLVTVSISLIFFAPLLLAAAFIARTIIRVLHKK